VGFGGWSGRVGKISPELGFELAARLARSEALYHLRYTTSHINIALCKKRSRLIFDRERGRLRSVLHGTFLFLIPYCVGGTLIFCEHEAVVGKY
jgi:hypothetical protein